MEIEIEDVSYEKDGIVPSVSITIELSDLKPEVVKQIVALTKLKVKTYKKIIFKHSQEEIDHMEELMRFLD